MIILVAVNYWKKLYMKSYEKRMKGSKEEMVRIREVEEIDNLNGYSEELMEKVLEYLQMQEEQIFQNEKGEIEVYENADDVKSLLKYLKASRIDEDEVGYVDKLWFNDGMILTVWSIAPEGKGEIILMIPYEITPKSFLRSIE